MNDDNRRFDDLCDRYTERLVRDLVRFGCLDQDAREIAQEALFATWQKLHTIRPGAEWAYVRTAAHRLAINRATRGGDRTNVPLEALGGAPRDKSESVEERLIRSEQNEQFQRQFNAAVEELPQETMLVLVMRRRGYGPKEIATHLGVHGTAVRSRLARAVKHLRERVDAPPQGLSWAELAGDNDDDDKK
jgi:RNA polymerase sigma factor (sigma-70 family)